MSESSQWGRVKELFHAALDVDPATQTQWLHEHVGDDEALLAELGELLAAHRGDSLAPGEAMRVDPWGGIEQVGPYRIGCELARGGMGRVFEATREHPRRRVALKVLKIALDDTRAVKRFEYESQILADLAHPNIAHVYESGTTVLVGQTMPWYAMELIDGAQSLVEAAASRDRSGRLELMLQVCDAVHHAHLHGIVHRDLKPGNVLLDRNGTVKLIDFGIAKSMAARPDEAQLTTHGVVLGTLAYMSPEQAEGRRIDGRVDVYALGVMLYELCAGRPPYVLRPDALREAMRTICEEPPAVAPLIAALVPEDLRLVVLKCLAKEPEQRYASVAALAADLRGVLTGGAIAARPPSLGYQLRRFARRNRGLVAAVAVVLVTLTGAAVVSTWGLLEARAARERAEQARVQEQAERLVAEQARNEAEAARDFATELLYAADPWRSPGGDVTVDELLSRASARLDASTNEPRHELWARNALLEIYEHLGRPREAEREARRVIALATDRADLTPIRLKAMRALAAAVMSQGLSDDGLALASDAVQAHERHYGPDDPETWLALAVQGECLQARGELHEAAARFRWVATRFAERAGPDDPQTLDAKLSLARAEHALGDLSGARAVFREVWDLRRATLGPEHPDTLSVELALGRILMEAGDPAEAEAMIAEVERTYARVVGPSHERTLAAGLSRAAALRRLGRAAEAVPLVERAVALAEETKGAAHPDVLIAKNNLALTLGDANELARSEALYLELVETWRERAADGEGSYLVVAVNYANVAKRLHHSERALPVLDEFLARGRREYPADFWMLDHASTLRASLDGEAIVDGQSERARAHRIPRGPETPASTSASAVDE